MTEVYVVTETTLDTSLGMNARHQDLISGGEIHLYGKRV
jgi:hypothetical protein